MLLFALFPVFPVAAGQPEVTVVLSEDGGPYAEFSEELKKELEGKAEARVVEASSGQLPRSGLTVAVGMKAAAALAGSGAPSVLNVLIPKSGYEDLLHDFPQRANSSSFSAIFLDQPGRRQAHLVAAVLPDVRKVGLMFSAPSGDIAMLGAELGRHGMLLYQRQVSGEDTLFPVLQDVLQQSEVLIALPDARIYNSSTIRNILLTTYRNNVPLIGFSPGYVRAGALCAVYSTPSQIAGQVAASIRTFSETGSLPSPRYPKEFKVLINEQVARSLGLHVQDASILHDEIKAVEREGL